MRRLAVLLAVLVYFAAATPVGAVEGIRITADIRERLGAVSAYLDGIDTLQSDFLQISSTGESAEGTILLSRPDRLRIDYAPPTPVLIVANGAYLSYVDTELNQVHHIPVEDTPAGFLLSEDFSFTDGTVTVTGVEQGANTLRVSVVQTADPLAGELTMVFTEKPLTLRKWTVVDAQGVVTDLTLVNPRYGFPIADERFDYQPPTTDTRE